MARKKPNGVHDKQASLSPLEYVWKPVYPFIRNIVNATGSCSTGLHILGPKAPEGLMRGES